MRKHYFFGRLFFVFCFLNISQLEQMWMHVFCINVWLEQAQTQTHLK